MRTRLLGPSAILFTSLAIIASASAQEAPGAEAPAPQPAPVLVAPTPQPPQDGQKKNGFVVGLNMSTSLTVLDIGADQKNPHFSNLGGGLFLGAKLDRFIFGLGFDLQRVSTDTSTSTPGAATAGSATDTSILIMPGVRVAALRSADRRVELFGQFDIGLGHTFSSETPTQAPADTSNSRLVYDLGPGVRYWIHPQFAMSALVALRGDFTWYSKTEVITTDFGTAVTTKTHDQALTSILGGLEFLGVF